MSKENKKEKKHSFRKFLFFILLFIILTVLYSRYLGTKGLLVKEYEIENNKLPHSFNNLKIAHFSDLHYGRTTDLTDVKELVRRINLKKVDIIIFSGDLFDKSYNVNQKDIENITNELKKLNSTYGSFYVNGENDLKTQNFDNIMNESNFISIIDKTEEIISKNNEKISLTGIGYNSNSIDFLSKLNEYNYKILVIHKPDDFDDYKAYNFSLALSGHSHNNQINIPYVKAFYSQNGSKKYYEPYYKIDNTDFYISSGIGTSDYSFRFFNRPSFNIYKIKDSLN